MGNRLMEAVRSVLGLTPDAEKVKFDRRIADREERLRTIDDPKARLSAIDVQVQSKLVRDRRLGERRHS